MQNFKLFLALMTAVAILLTMFGCSSSKKKTENTTNDKAEEERNNDSYTRSLSVITDMVHDNPGEDPWVTQYDDCGFLSGRGYTGKVFFLSEAAQLAIDWQEYDKDVFPKNSVSYNWVKRKKAELHQKYGEAKESGLKVYFMMDFISLPTKMKTLYGNDIMTGGKIDINKPKTQEIIKEMMREIFTEFTELDGFYLRYGESYVGYYSPYHFGNNPIAVSGTKAADHTTLLKLFREEVCEKYGKDVIYRTWSTEVGENSFTTSKNLYLQITDAVEPHENLYIAVKHTAGDFWRNYTFNQTIGIGKHQQIIEIQCSREYEGKGAYPNYIAGGVINGFPEYKWQMNASQNKSLRDVVNCENSLVVGIWTWSRGGGWGGPYTNGTQNPNGDELWSDLNAYVLTQWAKDTSKTDTYLVKCYAKDILGMNETDAENFVRLAELSADAVLYGIGTNSSPVLNQLWTRDASVNRDNFVANANTIFKNKKGDLYPKLEERRKAVQLYEQMMEIADSFDDSLQKKDYITITTRYGYYFFSICERMYTAAISYLEYNHNGTHTPAEINAIIDEAYDLLAAWEKLYADEPMCPTLYNRSDFTTILEQYRCVDVGSAENLAAHKKVTVNHEHNAFKAPYATDGNHDNTDKDNPARWNAGNIANTECWIYVDLGEAKEFNRLLLYWNLKNSPKGYEILVSDDAQNWSSVITLSPGLINSNDTKSYIQQVDFDTQTARYVKIYVSAENRVSDTYNWVSLVEFEVYNVT